MIRKSSGFKVGDTWEATDQYGSTGKVWLVGIMKTFEYWKWSFHFSDGSGLKFDWTTNKASAVSECPISARFKRVKR